MDLKDAIQRQIWLIEYLERVSKTSKDVLNIHLGHSKEVLNFLRGLETK
jgi:hypothetical protein